MLKVIHRIFLFDCLKIELYEINRGMTEKIGRKDNNFITLIVIYDGFFVCVGYEKKVFLVPKLRSKL